MGPVALVTLPPLRRALGDVDPEPIPMSYPSKHTNAPVSTAKNGLVCRITNWLVETNRDAHHNSSEGSARDPPGLRGLSEKRLN